VKEPQYWYLAPGSVNDSSDNVLSAPWWPEAAKHQRHEGGETVAAPILFTSLDDAIDCRQVFRDNELDDYVDLINRVGEERTNAALNNTAENTLTLEVHPIDRDTLLMKLEDAEFPYVFVDDKLKLRLDFMEELRKS
jgi:hypothetical protein